MSPPRALAELVGRWRIDRRIEDARAGEVARFEGWAEWRPLAEGGCEMVERGTLTLPGQAPLEARQRTLWQPVPGGARVAFADGRPFHEVRFSPVWRTVHDCPPDRYAVRYDFAAFPDWRTEWAAEGPAKTWRSASRYRPAGQLAAAGALRHQRWGDG